MFPVPNSITFNFPEVIREEFKKKITSSKRTDNLYTLFQSNAGVQTEYDKWSKANSRIICSDPLLSDAEYASTKAHCKRYVKFDAIAGVLATICHVINKIALKLLYTLFCPPTPIQKANDLLDLYMCGAYNAEECWSFLLPHLFENEMDPDATNVTVLLGNLGVARAKELLLARLPNDLGTFMHFEDIIGPQVPYLKTWDPIHIEELLSKKNINDHTPLHKDTALTTYAELLKLLDLNVLYRLFSSRDKQGNTPLHSVGIVDALELISRMSKERIEKLLSVQGSSKKTPLHIEGAIRAFPLLLKLDPPQARRLLMMRDNDGITVFEKLAEFAVKEPFEFNSHFYHLINFSSLGLTPVEFVGLLIEVLGRKNNKPLELLQEIQDVLELLPADQLRRVLFCKVYHQEKVFPLFTLWRGTLLKKRADLTVSNVLFQKAMGFSYPKDFDTEEGWLTYFNGFLNKNRGIARSLEVGVQWLLNSKEAHTQNLQTNYESEFLLFRYLWLTVNVFEYNWAPESYMRAFFEWLPSVDVAGYGHKILERISSDHKGGEVWKRYLPLLMKLPTDELLRELNVQSTKFLLFNAMETKILPLEFFQHHFKVDYNPSQRGSYVSVKDDVFGWAGECLKIPEQPHKDRILLFMHFLQIEIPQNYLTFLTRDELENLCREIPQLEQNFKFPVLSIRPEHMQEGEIVSRPHPPLVDYKGVKLVDAQFSLIHTIMAPLMMISFAQGNYYEFISRALRGAETQADLAEKPICFDASAVLWTMEAKIRCNIHQIGMSLDSNKRAEEYEIFCRYLSNIFHAYGVGEPGGDIDNKNGFLESLAESVDLCFPRWMKEIRQYYMSRPNADLELDNNGLLKDRLLDLLRQERVNILTMRSQFQYAEQSVHYINGALDTMRLELGTGLEPTGDIYALRAEECQFFYRETFYLHYTLPNIIKLVLEHVNHQKVHEDSVVSGAVTPEEVEECLLMSSYAQNWRRREYQLLVEKAKAMERAGVKLEEIANLLNEYNITWELGDSYEVAFGKLKSAHERNGISLKQNPNNQTFRRNVETQASLLQEVENAHNMYAKKQILIKSKWMTPPEPLVDALSKESIQEAQKINFLEKTIYDDKNHFTREAIIYFLGEMKVLNVRSTSCIT